MERHREMRSRVRIAMQRPVADYRARAVIEIEHRREAEIHAVRAELPGDRAPDPRRLARGAGDIAIPELAQRAHRRYRAEARAKPLHAAAFVIDGDEQRGRAQRPDLGGQCLQLRRAIRSSRANRITPPTSGSTSRLESSSDNCRPSTPSDDRARAATRSCDCAAFADQAPSFAAPLRACRRTPRARRSRARYGARARRAAPRPAAR